jgi:hypothetical protein
MAEDEFLDELARNGLDRAIKFARLRYGLS